MTNGRKLKDADYMNALAAAGLDHVQITIHSSVPETHDKMVGVTGAFNETVAGIENAVAGPVYLLTNTTLTTENVDDVEELVAFLATLGVEHVAANGLINSGGARDVDVGIPESALGPILSRFTAACAANDMTFMWYTPTQYCRFNPLTPSTTCASSPTATSYRASLTTSLWEIYSRTTGTLFTTTSWLAKYATGITRPPAAGSVRI